MRDRNAIKRLKLAHAQLLDAEKALAAAQFEARAALGCAIEAECAQLKETRTRFAQRHGISKAHVSDMIYGRRYSPTVATALMQRPTARTTGGADA